jgi:hypothetical protein
MKNLEMRPEKGLEKLKSGVEKEPIEKQVFISGQEPAGGALQSYRTEYFVSDLVDFVRLLTRASMGELFDTQVRVVDPSGEAVIFDVKLATADKNDQGIQVIRRSLT